MRYCFILILLVLVGCAGLDEPASHPFESIGPTGARRLVSFQSQWLRDCAQYERAGRSDIVNFMDYAYLVNEGYFHEEIEVSLDIEWFFEDGEWIARERTNDD